MSRKASGRESCQLGVASGGGIFSQKPSFSTSSESLEKTSFTFLGQYYSADGSMIIFQTAHHLSGAEEWNGSIVIGIDV